MAESNDKQNSSLLLYSPCDTLKEKFFNLKTPQDVADLLEVSYSRLIYHIYKVSAEDRYIEFYVPKKSGALRGISAPSTALKLIQRKLSQVLYSVYEPKATVHGFVVGRSILTNAKLHQGKRFVFNLDLKDFFDSIHFGRVRGIFMAPPYELPSEVATVLAQICCYRNKLPQGAPTSPVISNMVCVRLDSELRLLAKGCRCRYTRYADDITFSTNLSQFPIDIVQPRETDSTRIVVGDKLSSIVTRNGFLVHEKKLRLQHRSQHQSVTGLTVNQFPNVSRKYLRKISSMLYSWDKFGLLLAQERYHLILQQEKEKFTTRLSSELAGTYLASGTNYAKEDPLFVEVLRGKMNFLRMVKGKDDSIYKKYNAWFSRLEERDCGRSFNSNPGISQSLEERVEVLEDDVDDLKLAAIQEQDLEQTGGVGETA